MPCRAEVPRLNAIARESAVVGIASGDKAEDVRRFRAETGATYPIVLDDGAVARAYGITASPTCVLVARHGAIQYRGTHAPEHLR